MIKHYKKKKNAVVKVTTDNKQFLVKSMIKLYRSFAKPLLLLYKKTLHKMLAICLLGLQDNVKKRFWCLLPIHIKSIICYKFSLYWGNYQWHSQIVLILLHLLPILGTSQFECHKISILMLHGIMPEQPGDKQGRNSWQAFFSSVEFIWSHKTFMRSIGCHLKYQERNIFKLHTMSH